MFFLSQNETEKQQKEVQKGPKETAKPVSNKAQVSISRDLFLSKEHDENKSSLCLLKKFNLILPTPQNFLLSHHGLT